jgi:hypothetical protein
VAVAGHILARPVLVVLVVAVMVLRQTAAREQPIQVAAVVVAVRVEQVALVAAVLSLFVLHAP